MEAVAKRRFRCKITKKKFFPGQTYEGNQERIEELQKAGYLKGAPPIASIEVNLKEVVDVDKVSKEAEKNAYQLMTKKQLEGFLNQRGIEYSKRQPKAELIELLLKD